MQNFPLLKIDLDSFKFTGELDAKLFIKKVATLNFFNQTLTIDRSETAPQINLKDYLSGCIGGFKHFRSGAKWNLNGWVVGAGTGEDTLIVCNHKAAELDADDDIKFLAVEDGIYFYIGRI